MAENFVDGCYPAEVLGGKLGEQSDMVDTRIACGLGAGKTELDQMFPELGPQALVELGDAVERCGACSADTFCVLSVMRTTLDA